MTQRKHITNPRSVEEMKERLEHAIASELDGAFDVQAAAAKVGIWPGPEDYSASMELGINMMQLQALLDQFATEGTLERIEQVEAGDTVVLYRRTRSHGSTPGG